MRKIFFLCFNIFLIIGILGCQHLKHPISAVKKAATELFPPYSGLKASITVADFDAKTPKVTNEISSGLHQMLVSALSKTDRLILVEPQSSVKQSDGQQAKQEDKPSAADLVVAVTVLQFEPQTSGGTAGVGGGGSGNSGFLGGLMGSSVSKAHMTLDIRILKFSTSDVLAATHIRGQASDANMDKRTAADDCKLSGGLADFENTVMKKAICMGIVEAVRYITESIPASYYKYK